MRYVFLSLLFLTANTVFSAEDSALYYHFWRGFKRTNQSTVVERDGKKTFVDDPTQPMTWEAFEGKLNHWLIPATTSCCAESSLVAYLPTLLKKGEKPHHLPDELALVAYKSEAAYTATRNDPNNKEAIAYGPLHGDVFAMGDSKSKLEEGRRNASRSLIPRLYNKKVDLAPASDNFQLREAAYDILGKALNWQRGYTIVRISFPSEKGGLENALNDYFKESQRESGLLGHLVLVSEDYIVEYQNWTDREAKEVADHQKARLLLRDISSTPYLEWAVAAHKQVLSAKELLYDKLEFGSAGNIRFDVGKKPNPPAKNPRITP